MKIKTLRIFSIVLLVFGVVLSTARVHGEIAISEKEKVKIDQETGNIKLDAENETDVNARNGNVETFKLDDEEASSTEDKSNKKFDAEEHRSATAIFVQSLLNVANREGGIGDEVRVIAKTQNESASTTAKAVTEVENRGKVQTFFFGSDYKNLGQLRSEIVTTKNNIDQLKKIQAKAKLESDKTELEAQIKTLEDSQTKVDNFVKDHENTFSLFGWFFKMFSK
jgi:cell division protein FtsB